MVYIARYLARMDSEIQRIYHSAGQTATNSRLLHGRLRQAERRGENILSAWHTHIPRVLVMSTCSVYIQEVERQRKEAEEQQEDEEGWVKVTKGPKGAKARPHSEAANRRTLQKEMKKKKRKELLNFYTWQHRNTQKERK